MDQSTQDNLKMQPTKLIKMLLAFALVGLASAGCDSSCTKIAGDCAQALGHDNTNAVVPIAMYSCLDILCGTWSDKVRFHRNTARPARGLYH